MKRISREKLGKEFESIVHGDAFDDLRRKARVLRHHPNRFKPRHYEQIEKSYEKIVGDMSLSSCNVFKRDIVDGKDTINIFLCYLKPDELDPYHFRVRSDRVNMNETFWEMYGRELPLSLDHMHVGKRYEADVNFTREFEHNQNHVQFLYAFSLSLSHVMEKYMEENNRESSSIVVPQGEGLYMGRAFKEGKGFLENEVSIAAITDSGKYVCVNEKPSWEPSIDIKVNTLLDKNKMRPYQRHITNMLDKYWGNEKMYNSVMTFSNNYISGGGIEVTEQDRDNVLNLLKSLAVDIRSDLWQEMESIGDYSYIQKAKERGFEPRM